MIFRRLPFHQVLIKYYVLQCINMINLHSGGLVKHETLTHINTRRNSQPGMQLADEE